MSRSIVARRLFAGVLALCLLFPAATEAAGGHRAGTAPGVRLPADQAAHANVKNEWWYVVGHLHSGARTFGYEMTIFKFINVRPPGFNSPISIFRTDVAITDEKGHRFYHKITPYFVQSAQYSTSSLDLHVGNATLTGTSLSAMRVTGSLPGGNFSLALSSRRAPMYVGGNGYLPFYTGYTYYYSLTDLATSGTLKLHGKTYSTSGVSWLDHQWGDWSWSAIRGWTWMALQLHNGAQMSVFDFRGSGTSVQEANALLPNGKLLVTRNVSIISRGTWVSPHTSGAYPASVVVRIPALRATLTVRPTVADQELVWQQEKRGSYWEGSSRVSGTYRGKAVTGDAYLELTGYALG